MAKRIKQPSASIDVTGLSTSDIVNMDVYSLSNKDLYEVTKRLVSSANKRIRRLQGKGYAEYSPSLNKALEGGKQKFSVKGMYNTKTGKFDRNAIEKEFAKMKRFVGAETSTVKGFEQVRKDVKNRVGDFPDLETEKQFWKEYNKYVKDNKDKMQHVDSKQIQKLLHQQRVVKSHSLRGAKSVLTKYLNSIYEENKEKEFNDDALMFGDDADVFHLQSDF